MIAAVTLSFFFVSRVVVPSSRENGTRTGIKKRVGDVVAWTFGKIDEACGKENDAVADKEKFKKYFCMFWKKEKEVAQGVVLEKIKPLTRGYDYCAGLLHHTLMCAPSNA